MKLQKILDVPGLAKDLNSGAVVNTDNAALERAKALKNQRLKEKDNQNFQNLRLNNLETEISEIKNALKLILERIS